MDKWNSKSIQVSTSRPNGKGDLFLAAVADHQNYIQEINLFGGLVTDTGLAKLMRSCPNLHPDKVLSDKKGDAFLTALVTHQSQIEQIDVSSCDLVTDAGLAVMMRGCPRLRTENVKTKDVKGDG